LVVNVQDTGIQCGDATAALTGQRMGGPAIKGSDDLQARGCKAKP